MGYIERDGPAKASAAAMVLAHPDRAGPSLVLPGSSLVASNRQGSPT